MYGDNIYLSQTAYEESISRRLQTGMRQVTLSSLEISTPEASNQLYLSGLRNVVLDSITFSSISNINTLEGGAIYIKDCFNVDIQSCDFVGQSSKIRGGALYLSQGSDYFGVDYD